MQKQLGVGFIPYEIGDMVLLYTGKKATVSDIKMVQYIKDKKVEFEVQIDSKTWINPNHIKEIVE